MESGGGTGAHGDDVGTRAWRKWGDGHGRTRRRGGTGTGWAWGHGRRGLDWLGGDGELGKRVGPRTPGKLWHDREESPTRRTPPSLDDLSPSSRPRPLHRAQGASAPGPASPVPPRWPRPSLLPSDWSPLGRRRALRPLIGWRFGAQARNRAGAGAAGPGGLRAGTGRPDPAGGRGRKMAELRALVAVKRVIDFAVKVIGSPCAPRLCASGVTSVHLMAWGESSHNL